MNDKELAKVTKDILAEQLIEIEKKQYYGNELNKLLAER